MPCWYQKGACIVRYIKRVGCDFNDYPIGSFVELVDSVECFLDKGQEDSIKIKDISGSKLHGSWYKKNCELMPEGFAPPFFGVRAYDTLAVVLIDAYKQASEGKGKDRHATNNPFDKQPILEISRMVGVGGPLFQAMKKCQEATRLPTVDRQVAELLGAINYIAAAIILLKEQQA